MASHTWNPQIHTLTTHAILLLCLLLTYQHTPCTLSLATEEPPSERHYSRHKNSLPTNSTHPEPKTPAPLRNLCFIHVGKSGGNSLNMFMREAIQNGDLGNAMQVHQVSLSDPQNVHTMPFAMDYCNGQSGQEGYFEEDEGVVHTWRTMWPPINRPSSYQACVGMNVFLWVRDPISRFASTWNYKDHFQSKRVIREARQRGYLGKNDTHIDLNSMLETMTEEEVYYGEESMWEDLFAILKFLPHAITDMSFYLGERQELPNSMEERSKSCKDILDTLPIWFVGRTEHFEEDWELFMTKTMNHPMKYPLVHTHKTHRVGKTLSRPSLSLLRRFYQVEYDCILQLVQMGWLDMEYYLLITRTKEYMY